jgi:hypothetical protein
MTVRGGNGTALQAEQIETAIERLRVRVEATHAHHQSLHRAAQGIATLHGWLTTMLQADVGRGGWTPESRLADSALGAMRQQLDAVLETGHDLPVEEQRLCLGHALCRATDALVLLRATPE